MATLRLRRSFHGVFFFFTCVHGFTMQQPLLKRPCAPCGRAAQPLTMSSNGGFLGGIPNPFAKEKDSEVQGTESAGEGADEEGKITLEKVAALGIAGILSIAVAETVFWVLSFPTSELLYYISTGEWIDLTQQEGQLKVGVLCHPVVFCTTPGLNPPLSTLVRAQFLAFSAGWGGVGGVIAQYRTVLTAAAMTPWMDACVAPPSAPPHAR
jgi:hypothetical protein